MQPHNGLRPLLQRSAVLQGRSSWSTGHAFVSGARGLRCLNPAEPVKSDTMLPTARLATAATFHQKVGAVLPGRNDAEMAPRKLVTRFGVIRV